MDNELVRVLLDAGADPLRKSSIQKYHGQIPLQWMLRKWRDSNYAPVYPPTDIFTRFIPTTREDLERLADSEWYSEHLASGTLPPDLQLALLDTGICTAPDLLHGAARGGDLHGLPRMIRDCPDHDATRGLEGLFRRQPTAPGYMEAFEALLQAGAEYTMKGVENLLDAPYAGSADLDRKPALLRRVAAVSSIDKFPGFLLGKLSLHDQPEDKPFVLAALGLLLDMGVDPLYGGPAKLGYVFTYWMADDPEVVAFLAKRGITVDPDYRSVAREPWVHASPPVQ